MLVRLSAARRRALDNLTAKTRDLRHWKRLRILQLLDDCEGPTEVARILDCTRETVYRTVRLWEERGRDFKEMGDAPRAGRPHILGPEEEGRLTDLLDSDPVDHGYAASGWTLPLLQRHLRAHWDLQVSVTSLRRLMRRMGWAWKRPRFICAMPDPERERKLRELKRMVAYAEGDGRGPPPRVPPDRTAGAPIDTLGRRAVVLVEDETHMRELPPLRAGWSRVGVQKALPITGRNARRTLFGALNIRTGARYVRDTVRNRAADFGLFLHHLRRCHPGRGILLILDQGSCHTAKVSARLATELGITMAWLPTACPELNPIESLWRDVKQQVSANRVYPTVVDQTRAALHYLRSLPHRVAMRKAGLLSENMWLPT
jgi:transposase